LILVPQRQLFAHAMDLNSFEHQMDGDRAEDPADQHHDGEFEAPADVQLVDLEVEELLLEGQVSGF
jgi:hypothetical protein